MKTLKFIGMALIAIFVCANFVSCSKDGEGGGKGYMGEKQLVKLVIGDDKNSYYTYAFSYDNKGRATRAKVGEGNYVWNHRFVWDGYSLEVNEDDGSLRAAYRVEDGFVQFSDHYDYDSPTQNSRCYYNYNFADRLVGTSGVWSSELTWNGDELTSVTGWSEFDVTYTYGNESCEKGYYPLFSEEPIEMVHPEIFGIRTKKLPISSTNIFRGANRENDFSETYTYEFNAEGYVSKINVRQNDGSTYSYTLTWR